MSQKNQTPEQIINELLSAKKLDHLLLENADEALFFYSIEGKLIYVNSAFENITGYATQELYDSNFIANIHPDDEEWTMKLWEGLFRGEFFENAEFRIVKKDGEVRWSQSSWKMVLDDNGENIGIQGKQQDITERKKIEEEKNELIASLQIALKEIRTLRGIIPICSYCHSIRDDNGSWDRVETYISNNSDTQLSHGICPECFMKAREELVVNAE